MTVTDILRTAFAGLFQQRLRTSLTLLGVTVGALLLFSSISGSRGVMDGVIQRLQKDQSLLRIVVSQGYVEDEDEVAAETTISGEMSDDRRARLMEAENRQRTRRRIPIDSAMVQRLERIPHVVHVLPEVEIRWFAMAGDAVEQVFALGRPADDAGMADRIVAGRALESDDHPEVLLHEFLVYRLGFADESDVEKILGQGVRFESRPGASGFSWALQSLAGSDLDLSARENLSLDETFRSMLEKLDESELTSPQREVLQKVLGTDGGPDDSAEITVPEQAVVTSGVYKVAGVFRGSTQQELEQNSEAWRFSRSEVILPIHTARREWERLPMAEEEGFWSAEIHIDRLENVTSVATALKETGLRFWSLVDFIDRVRSSILVITSLITALAAISFAVAAIGMMNTMLMNVMERRREIGIMKAVGARDRDVQWVFLVEGALVGLAGGALGVALGWLVALAAVGHVRRLLENEFGDRFDQPLFAYPIWLIIGTPLIAALVTTLASFIPARRAARMDPVSTLRHE